MDFGDGYSSEEEFFNDTMVKLIALDALDSDDIDSDDGFKVFDATRRCHPGGAGTPRPDRAAPRPWIPGLDGEPDCRRHFGMDGEWGRIFFKPGLVLLPDSLAWDDFREKFRVPFPMFNWILDAVKESGKFSYQVPENGGNDPQPLCMKLVAYMRYLAIGA